MPVDSSKFGSQSSKMSSSSGGSSTGGSCTSVSELRSAMEEDQQQEQKQHSKGSASELHSVPMLSSVDVGGEEVSLSIAEDDFDAAIEESMEMLEKNVVLESSDDELRNLRQSRRSDSQSSASSSSGVTTPSTEEETFHVPHLSEEDIDKKLALFNQSIQLRSPDTRFAHAANHHVSFPMPPPPPMPPIRFDRYSVTVGRRRLSQCKEEENEEEESGTVNSALVSMKKSTSLNTDSSTGEKGLFSDYGKDDVKKDEEEDEVIVDQEPEKIEELKVPVSRFTVTKTEPKDKGKETVVTEKPLPSPKVTQLRTGVAHMLRNSTAKQNSQTIHFPCSTPVQNRVSVQSMFEPHLDKRYFDSSLVEIRSMNDSTQTVNEDPNDSVDGGSGGDDIWVKRSEKAAADVSLLWELIGGRNKYLLGRGLMGIRWF